METYVMSRIDDHEIDCYHQYIAQTNYRCERPEDGDGMMLEPRGCLDKPQEIYKPVSAYSYPNGPQSFGDIGYRRPVRQRRAPNLARINNTRNGLHSPQEPRADCGDYYSSLPGLGSYQRPLTQHRFYFRG
ncbi:uncharacterized protein LOC117780560 [Drosophila innubila]|uniref:uncharacterized protein LOC117780560 n=1 Tax=Drosophila innubila TaxID=198719 RepID=UPI00148D15D2|nr:uncharacterized protein LOC117780560 [Drosophila innubila]